MDTPIRTTELAAVNVMLSLMGSSPVNSLVPPYGVDVAQARSILTEVSQDIQSEGWHFNQQVDYTLMRDSNGRIPLASNILSVDADTDSAVDIIAKGDFLYDLVKNTDIFTHDVKCEVMFVYPFDEVPEIIRRYIMIKAARIFQVRFLGSENQEAFTRADEARARARALRHEGDVTDSNILNSPGPSYISRRSQHRRFGN